MPALEPQRARHVLAVDRAAPNVGGERAREAARSRCGLPAPARDRSPRRAARARSRSARNAGSVAPSACTTRTLTRAGVSSMTTGRRASCAGDGRVTLDRDFDVGLVPAFDADAADRDLDRQRFSGGKRDDPGLPIGRVALRAARRISSASHRAHELRRHTAAHVCAIAAATSVTAAGCARCALRLQWRAWRAARACCWRWPRRASASRCPRSRSRSPAGTSCSAPRSAATFAPEDPGLLQLHELRVQRAAQPPHRRVRGGARQRSRAGARRGAARSGPRARSVRLVRARPAVAGAPLRHPGRPHPADLRRDDAHRVRQQQHPDRAAARLSVPAVDSPGRAAGDHRRSAAHARTRLAVEFSRRQHRRRRRGCRWSTPAAGTPACRRTASTACSSGPAR